MHEADCCGLWCRYLVLDEADRIMDMGFEEDLRPVPPSPATLCPIASLAALCLLASDRPI